MDTRPLNKVELDELTEWWQVLPESHRIGELISAGWCSGETQLPPPVESEAYARSWWFATAPPGHTQHNVLIDLEPATVSMSLDTREARVTPDPYQVRVAQRLVMTLRAEGEVVECGLGWSDGEPQQWVVFFPPQGNNQFG